jgi:plastocyanin
MEKTSGKYMLLVVAVLVLLGIGGYVFVTANKQAVSSTTTSIVNIRGFTFTPDTLTIKKGTAVTWVNLDTAVHTVKSDVFSSQDLAQGDSFEYTFNTTGSFNYSCGVHPSMKGKVIVSL